ncbi:MAG: RNA polymerase sigma factor [Ardenticatenaceae bacterium]|nr:RNA polymerase sigma factor [Ardenticatenaceae bacterium]
MSGTDELLVEHLRSNDAHAVKAAWAAWYTRDGAAVQSALRRAGASEDDVEDLAHDAFIAAVGRIQAPHFHYRGGRLRNYVCVVALNRWRSMRYRSLSREVPFSALLAAARAAIEPATPVERRVLAQWLAGQVHAGLSTLDPEERRLLLAHHLDGRTQRDLAAERQVPASTIGVRLWRLRARLQRQPELRQAWEALAA